MSFSVCFYLKIKNVNTLYNYHIYDTINLFRKLLNIFFKKHHFKSYFSFNLKKLIIISIIKLYFFIQNEICLCINVSFDFN